MASAGASTAPSLAGATATSRACTPIPSNMRHSIRFQLQVAHQRQELALLRVGEEAQRLRARAAEAERQLAAVRRRSAAAAADVQQRKGWLADAQQELGRLRQQANATAVAQEDTQARAYLRSLDSLAREQRTK